MERPCLYSLVVNKRINRQGGGLVIEHIHFPSKLCSPLSNDHCENSVYSQRTESDGSIHGTEVVDLSVRIKTLKLPTKIPQTRAISIAVGTILNNMEDIMKVIPLRKVSAKEKI